MNVEIWNVLHDAGIVKVRSDVRNIVLTIEIEYLLERFPDQPSHLLVTLIECDLFRYSPFVGQATTVVSEIEKAEPEILSAESVGNNVKVVVVNGILEARYLDFHTVTSTGREVELQELIQVADQYWDDFQARGRAKQT